MNSTVINRLAIYFVAIGAGLNKCSRPFTTGLVAG
jgi:hypothetical protein